MSTIPKGLKANIMRQRMEDKATVTSIGGLYMGGDTSISYGGPNGNTISAYQTELLEPENSQYALVSGGAGAELTYKQLSTSGIQNSAITASKLGSGSLISPDPSQSKYLLFIREGNGDLVYNSVLYHAVGDTTSESWESANWEQIPNYSPGTGYYKNDIVYYSGQTIDDLYVCSVAYSLSFITPDHSSSWEHIVAYVNQGHSYKRGDLVIYDSTLYQCVKDCTTRRTEGLAPSLKYWKNLTFITPTYTSLALSGSNLCYYDGDLYQCVDNTSGSWDSSKWELIESYDTSATYNAGDFCFYNWNLYQCLVNNITGPWSSSDWLLITQYAKNVTYNKGNFCYFNGALYRCLSNNIHGTWDPNMWDRVCVYNSTKEYFVNNSVDMIWGNGNNEKEGFELKDDYYSGFSFSDGEKLKQYYVGKLVDSSQNVLATYVASTQLQLNFSLENITRFTIQRTQSQYQGAELRYLCGGDTVYYGDVLHIIAEAASPYLPVININGKNYAFGDLLYTVESGELIIGARGEEEHTAVSLVIGPLVEAIYYKEAGATSYTKTTQATLSGFPIQVYAVAKAGCELDSPFSSYTANSPYTITSADEITWVPTAHAKQFTLRIPTVQTAEYSTVVVSRTKSPYQEAPITTLSAGDYVYYGDVLQIVVDTATNESCNLTITSQGTQYCYPHTTTTLQYTVVEGNNSGDYIVTLASNTIYIQNLENMLVSASLTRNNGISTERVAIQNYFNTTLTILYINGTKLISANQNRQINPGGLTDFTAVYPQNIAQEYTVYVYGTAGGIAYYASAYVGTQGS